MTMITTCQNYSYNTKTTTTTTTTSSSSNSSDISGSSNSSSWIVCNIFLNKLNVKRLFRNSLAFTEMLRREPDVDLQVDRT
jgi:hypothetical protein